MRHCGTQALEEARENDHRGVHRNDPPDKEHREKQNVLYGVHGDPRPGTRVDISVMQLMHRPIQGLPVQQSMYEIEVRRRSKEEYGCCSNEVAGVRRPGSSGNYPCGPCP